MVCVSVSVGDVYDEIDWFVNLNPVLGPGTKTKVIKNTDMDIKQLETMTWGNKESMMDKDLVNGF